MSVYRKLLAGGILAAAVGGACLNQAVAIDDDAAVTSKTHEFTVKEIKVTGLYRVTKGAVLLALPIQAGDSVTMDDIQKALKKVYATHNFDNISVSYDDETGVLNLKMTERPTIVKISYAGNDAIKTDQIEDIIKAQGVSVGETLDVIKLKDLERSLEDYYHGMGRYQAKVKAILVYLPRNRVDVKFNFTEGVAAKIEQINIVGNKAFDDERLLAQMELRDQVPWWNFIASRNFNAQKFNGDIETLRSYYMNRGYVRFSIDRTRVEVTPELKGVYLTISLTEGEQYTLDKFNIIGETYGHRDEMQALIPLEKGDIYNAARIAHAEEILSDYMGKYGYAYTKVHAIPEIDDKNKLVSLKFNVEPGKRIYVTDVQIKGNTITTDDVIRREIRQMDGTWLSNENIRVSKRRLNQLGFFETVEVEPKHAGTEVDTVVVEAKVKERPTGSIKAGIGYGTQTGINLSGEISQNNFLGYGGRASIGINTNKYDKKLELSYNEPYLTVDGLSLGASIFYEDFKAGDANIVDYNNTKYGAGLNLGYPLDEHNYITYGVGYEHNKLSQTSAYAQIKRFWSIYASEDRTNNEVVFQNYKLSLSFNRNYLDKGVLPTSGDKQNLRFYVTVPGSDTQYYKMSADTTHFFPLDKESKFIINFRGKAGYGNGYGDKDGYDQILPFFENFYLGGDEWLRGFKYNAVGPRALYATSYMGNRTVLATNTSVGGNAILAGSLQLIVPTPFAEEGYENSLRTSLFVDVGTLWDTNYNPDNYSQCMFNCEYMYDFSSPKHYRASAGVTLSWISPLGPLGFTIARPLKKREGDKTEFFSFNIGRTF